MYCCWLSQHIWHTTTSFDPRRFCFWRNQPVFADSHPTPHAPNVPSGACYCVVFDFGVLLDGVFSPGRLSQLASAGQGCVNAFCSIGAQLTCSPKVNIIIILVRSYPPCLLSDFLRGSTKPMQAQSRSRPGADPQQAPSPKTQDPQCPKCPQVLSWTLTSASSSSLLLPCRGPLDAMMITRLIMVTTVIRY